MKVQLTEANANGVSSLNGHPAVPLERSLTAVLEISKLINLSLDLNAMFKILAHKVHLLMGYECAVILLSPDELKLTWVGYYGLSEEYIRVMNAQGNNLATPHMAQGATGRAYRTKRPAQINNLEESSVRLWRDAGRKEGIASFIATPMVLHDRVLGFINCYTRQPHVFSQPEIDLLSIIGNQAAIAVEAARLHDQTLHRAEELSRINQVLSEQNHLLSQQRTALLQTEQIHRQLTEVILEDGGLTAIVKRISGLIDRPVALYDADGRQLALAGEDALRHDSGGRVADPPLVCHPDGSVSELPNALQLLPSERRPQILEYAFGPAASRIPGCTLPVMSGSLVMGYLVAFQMAEPCEELDRRAVEHGATVVALELLKQRAVIETEQQLRGGFVDDLLTGDFEDDEAIVRRAAYLGFDFDASYRIFVFSIDRGDDERASGSTSARDVDQLRRHLLRLTLASCALRWPKAIATLKGDGVAVVWPEDPLGRIGAAEAARMLKDDLGRSLRTLTVSVGVGGKCHEPAEFARSFAEARRCVEVLRGFQNTNRVLMVEELGLHRFLIRPGDEPQLLEFAHRRLDALFEHERRYSSELLKTLEVFLNTECSLTKAAEQLSVHINTVQYRVRKVEDLTGVRLRTPQGLMEIHLALLIASLRPAEFLTHSPVGAAPASPRGSSALAMTHWSKRSLSGA